MEQDLSPSSMAASAGMGFPDQYENKQRTTPPPRLNLALENEPVRPVRMPVFSVTSASEDIALIRKSIAPAETEKLGRIAASEDGWWMFFQPPPQPKYRGGHWLKTDIRVHPQVDPRLLCTDIHEEFIKVCNEGFHDDSLVDAYYALVVKGIDEGRRHFGKLEKMGVGGYSRRHNAFTSAGNESPNDRGRSQAEVFGPRSILRSPEQNKENSARYESPDSNSARNVTFNLYSSKAGAQPGAPSEVILQPAGRTRQCSPGRDSPQRHVNSHHQHAQSDPFSQHGEFTYHGIGPQEVSFAQYAPPERQAPTHHYMVAPDGSTIVVPVNAPIWPRFERQLPAQHAAQLQADKSPQLRTPISFDDPDIQQQLQQPSGWIQPHVPELTVHSDSDMRSGLGYLPPPLLVGNRTGLMAPPGLAESPYPAAAPVSRFSPDTSIASPGYNSPIKSSSGMSPTQRPTSEHSETDELLNAFPGRLGGDEEDRIRGARPSEELFNAPQAKMFHPPKTPQRSTKLHSTPIESKKPTSMMKFAGMASKLIDKVSKGRSNDSGSATSRPGQIMRRVSEKMTGNVSTAFIPTGTRSRSGSWSSRAAGGKKVEVEADEESEDDQQPKISMSPGDQMWMIGRVEFILNQVANQFLMTQKEAGRMKPETVARITKDWHKQNRPQVIEFMFDLKSQLELTRANQDTFMFYGPRGQNHMAQLSLIASWRSITRELANRTFCLPNHALKKLMVDAFRVLEMLGGDNEAFCEFRDIQRSISDAAEKAARDQGENVARGAGNESGVTKKIQSPLMISNRGIVNDHEAYYNDGIFKG